MSLKFVMLFLVWQGAWMVSDPPSDRAENLEFDPATGQWIEIQPPQPGTPEGDLAIARRHLVREQISSARKGFGRWIKTHGPDHALTREAQLGLAESELAAREHYKSHLIFKSLMAELGTDEITQRAAELDFNVAEVFLAGVKRKWLGMRILPAQDIGIAILDDIAGQYPDTTLGELAYKTKADYYFQRGDFDLAEDEYGRMVAAYPLSRYLRLASLRRAQAALAQFPGTQFDDAPLIEAEERFARFRTEFPQAAQAEQVDVILEDIRNTRAQKEFEIGQYYDKTGQAQAAAFYFRSVARHWPGTLAATQAESELARRGLTAPQRVDQ